MLSRLARGRGSTAKWSRGRFPWYERRGGPPAGPRAPPPRAPAAPCCFRLQAAARRDAVGVSLRATRSTGEASRRASPMRGGGVGQPAYAASRNPDAAAHIATEKTVRIEYQPELVLTGAGDRRVAPK